MRETFHFVPFCSVGILNHVNSLPIQSFQRIEMWHWLSNTAIEFNMRKHVLKYSSMQLLNPTPPSSCST